MSTDMVGERAAYRLLKMCLAADRADSFSVHLPLAYPSWPISAGNDLESAVCRPVRNHNVDPSGRNHKSKIEFSILMGRYEADAQAISTDIAREG